MYDDFEYVPQLRHFQVLLSRYRSLPQKLQVLQHRFGLRRVAPSDPAPLSPEIALQIGEWLHANKDPHAMAWLASELDLGAGDGLVYYLRAHATLQDALDEVNRLASLLFPDGRFTCTTRDNKLRVVISPVAHIERLGTHLRYEAILVWFMRVLRDIAAVHLAVEHVDLMTHEAGHTDTLASLLGVTPHMSKPEFAIVYSASICDIHLPGASEALRKAIHPMFERRLNSLRQRDTPLNRVVEWLAHRASLSEARLELAATELAIGSSTLRRQLAQEDTSFSALLAVQRARIAMDAVLNTDEKTESLALRAGYADRSAFERAFRERFGITPAQCRKAAQQLLGDRRATDWSSPSAWYRHSPGLEPLRESLGQGKYSSDELCAALAGDPVLQLRLLGYCLHAGQPISQALLLDADVLHKVPYYVLCNLVDASLPKQDPLAVDAAKNAWQIAQLASGATSLLAPHTIPSCEPSTLSCLTLAASAYNLGKLAAPSLPENYVEGVDYTWLLLASWNAPPDVLKLLRTRKTPRTEPSQLLALSIAWAETAVMDKVAAVHVLKETRIAHKVPEHTLTQLEALASSAHEN
jgi:AraC-like DNA-binding protein